MDWKECLGERIAKEVKEDLNLIKSTLEISESKINSAKTLGDSHHISKICLFLMP
jgi:hypothetical protein